MKSSLYVLSIIFISILGNGVVRAQERSSSESLDLSRSHSETLDLSRDKKEASRPVDSTPRLTGAILLKPHGKNKEWPYLRSNNIDYRLETSDANAAAQISQCEPGDVCTVKGDIVEGAEPVLRAKSVKIESYADQNLTGGDEGGEITTVRGCKFKRDNFNPAMGETWKSPGGTVWGELELNADGSSVFVNIEKANAICASKGGRLPTRAEWQELAGCFDKLTGNTAPFRNLNLAEYFSLEKKGQPLFGKVFKTQENKFRSVQRFALDGEDGGWEIDTNDNAFVRCVGAHSN